MDARCVCRPRAALAGTTLTSFAPRMPRGPSNAGISAKNDRLPISNNVRVFGSIVRGENRSDSDLDLLVEFAPGRTLFDLVGLKLDLEDLLHVDVDVVTPNSLRYIRDRVLTEAQPI